MKLTHSQQIKFITDDISSLMELTNSTNHQKKLLSSVKISIAFYKNKQIQKCLEFLNLTLNEIKTNSHKQSQLISFILITTLSYLLVIYIEIMNQKESKNILSQLLTAINKKTLYQHSCSILFKTRSLYALTSYDFNSNLQYKYEDNVQCHFWYIVGRVLIIAGNRTPQQIDVAFNKCQKLAEKNKNYKIIQAIRISKSRNQMQSTINSSYIQREDHQNLKLSIKFMDYIIEQFLKRQYQILNKQINKENVKNQQIPQYYKIALILAIKKNNNIQNGIKKAICQSLQKQKNINLIIKLSKTQFFINSINNYQKIMSKLINNVKKKSYNIYKFFLEKIKIKRKSKINLQLKQVNINEVKNQLFSYGIFVKLVNIFQNVTMEMNKGLINIYFLLKNNQDGVKIKILNNHIHYVLLTIIIDKLKYIKGIVFGKVSQKLMQKQHQDLQPWQCFSFICKDRTLDFCCKDVEKEAISWLVGVSYHIKTYINKQFPLYSVGRAHWKRITLKYTKKSTNPINKKLRFQFANKLSGIQQ